MKSKLLLVVFIFSCGYLSAQDQTIGPANNVNVIGNLVVKQSLVKSTGMFYPLYRAYLPYQGLAYLPTTDSAGRVKDHEGPPSNYLPNLDGKLYIYHPNNLKFEAIEINFEYFDLGDGDTLTFTSETEAVLLKVGKSFVPSGTYTFNALGLGIEFTTNADLSLGNGFSFTWHRLYNNPSNQQPILPAGNSFVFNRVTGAVSSGKPLPGTPGIYSTNFGYQNIATGDYAQAMGYLNEATGLGSVAIGWGAKAGGRSSVAIGTGKAAGISSAAVGLGFALGNYSFAAGESSHARGSHSVAVGRSTDADGDYSLAVGTRTKAPYYASVSIGSDNYWRPGNKTAWEPKDPLLIAGNGNLSTRPSNILELYKNGRLYVWSSLWLLSDEGLKKEMQPIESSLEKLSKITAHTFYWSDNNVDQNRQVGLLTDDVKVAFPELVNENLRGNATINYIGLIPHLVNAIGELKQQLAQKKGESKQADIGVCLCDNSQADKFSAYPNPAGNNLTVTITTEETGNGSLKLYDGNGRLVKQTNISIRNGKNTIPVNLPGLPAGNYELIAEWGKGMKKQVSIVKQ